MEITHFDVFLSRKSQDAHLAKILYDFLTDKGLRVFDSDHSLQEMGNADYSRAIDDALVNTEHLIVVGSSLENISSTWVEAEWRFFLNRKRSGKVKGNLLTVITEGIKIDELPPSLQNYEVFNIENTSLAKLLKYIEPPQNTLIKKPIEIIILEAIAEESANEGFENESFMIERRQDAYLKGRIELSSRDYESAYTNFLIAAELGQTDAQYKLAEMLYFGEGIQRDKLTAIKWYRKSAIFGNVRSQYFLKSINETW